MMFFFVSFGVVYASLLFGLIGVVFLYYFLVYYYDDDGLVGFMDGWVSLFLYLYIYDLDYDFVGGVFCVGSGRFVQVGQGDWKVCAKF
jgi:hypothetical protein